MSVFLTLKYILGLIIFVSGGSGERKNVALKVLDDAIFHSLKILSHTIQILEVYLLNIQYDLML